MAYPIVPILILLAKFSFHSLDPLDIDSIVFGSKLSPLPSPKKMTRVLWLLCPERTAKTISNQVTSR